MINIHEIVLDLYPQATKVVGNDIDSIQAFDAEGSPIKIDRLQCETKIAEKQSIFDNNEYQRKRAAEYPDFKEYLDGIVKGDQTQMQAYIDACLAVKEKHPKPQ